MNFIPRLRYDVTGCGRFSDSAQSIIQISSRPRVAEISDLKSSLCDFLFFRLHPFISPITCNFKPYYKRYPALTNLDISDEKEEKYK